MRSPARILVVDDQEEDRRFWAEVLTRDGHTVEAVESGEAALELINEQPFDVALLDLELGGISGVEVLAVLRRQALETVVIIMTAYASLDTAVEALRQGAHDYLFKPCRPAQLRESVRQGLLKRRQKIQQQSYLHKLAQHLSSDLEDLQALITAQPAELSAELVEPGEVEGRFLQRSGLIVDLSRYVITVDGYLLELSPTEFDILAYLASKVPRVITPQELVREVQGYPSELYEARSIVSQHIYHLRQKIKEASGRTDVIRTVRGVGYTIDE